MSLHSTRGVLLALVFLLGIRPAGADVGSEAKNLWAQLNPLSIALNPLIDRAASDGNEVAQQQLEHLRAIIHSELDYLQQIESNEIDVANKDARDRIDQFFTRVDQSIKEVSTVIDEQRRGLNLDLEARIKQLEEVENVLYGLPLTINPVVDTKGKNALFTYKSDGAWTDLYISGVGLKKDDETPTVSVRSESNSKPVTVTVVTSSVGLLHVRIPNNLVNKVPGDSRLYLEIKFRTGDWAWIIPLHGSQSFDLDVCSPSRIKQKIVFQSFARGQYWATRDTLHPKINVPSKRSIYIAGRGENVCATDANSDGWEPDLTKPNGGLSFWEPPGQTGTMDVNRPTLGCVALNANDRQNVEIMDVVVHQRKKRDVLVCDTPPKDDPYARCYCSSGSPPAPVTKEISLSPGDRQQFTLDNDSITGACKGDGITTEPKVTTVVKVLDGNGTILDQDTLSPSETKHLWDQKVLVQMNSQLGLVTASLRSACDVSAESQ